MTEKEFFTVTGSIAYCKNFRDLRIMYGLKRALLARLVRYQYIARLWLLRESAIISCLIENYEKIPRRTPSRFLIGIFARFAFLRKLNERLATSIQNSFTKTL